MKRTNVIFPGDELPYLKTAKPSNHLRNYVSFYFEVYLNYPEEKMTWHTSLPTLNTLICVNLDGPGWGYIDKDNQEQMLNSSMFVGHTLDTRQNKHPRGMRNFFVSLKPGLASLLFRSRQEELENTTIDLNYLFKNAFIEEKLCEEADNFQDRIKLFENIFSQKAFPLETNYKYQTVQNGLTHFSLQTTFDNQNLNRVCRELAVSYPTLYRYFKEVTSYSPKFCQKLEKFKKGLEQYKRHGYKFNHWEYGFTDFSHFVKVSKQITNSAPSVLLNQ